jgi:hypothetical protein
VRYGRGASLGILAAMLVGCVGVTPSSAPSTPPPSAPSMPSPTSSGSTAPSPTLDPEIAHAIDLRRSFGLRSDLAYVLAAADDPTTSLEFLSIPLYPAEDAKLMAAQADQDFAVSVIHPYAIAHADEFGGVYIDRADHPGVVTVLWTGHLDEHRAALAAALDGRFVLLREVRYSEAHLRDLQDQVSHDTDWMASVPARAESIGVDIIANVVTLDVSSGAPAAVRLIADHYGLGDQLQITSDGTGATLLPRGTVAGRVVGPDGKAVRDGELDLRWTSPDPGDCGGGDIGYGVGRDGTFQLPCQIGVRTIMVMTQGATGGTVELGRGTVTVRAGKTVHLTIHLTKAP